jgi:hypothetical protein
MICVTSVINVNIKNKNNYGNLKRITLDFNNLQEGHDMKKWVKCAGEILILDNILLPILFLTISGFNKIIFRV